MAFEVNGWMTGVGREIDRLPSNLMTSSLAPDYHHAEVTSGEISVKIIIMCWRSMTFEIRSARETRNQATVSKKTERGKVHVLDLCLSKEVLHSSGC